jgi:tRNA-specific 2-thiouridylase
MVNKKCVLLFSGGLDSRLALKIMQEQGYEVTCLYFKLPFSCSNFQDVEDFVKESKSKLVVFDCNQGELFKEYWKSISHAKYGRGQGANPCKDCKIFMFNLAKEFADEKGIGLIVTGEVLGERPMSQLKNSMNLIEEQSSLKGRLLRPLSAKLLPETEAEKQGLVDRSKFYDIQGRKRDKQIELAKKFKIKYPHPAGGCLLCEKLLKDRFLYLFKRGVSDKELGLVVLGRHFVINGSWIILGRNEQENKILEDLDVGKVFTAEDLDVIGPSAVAVGGKVSKKKVGDLIIAYSKEGNLELRKNFEKYKL